MEFQTWARKANALEAVKKFIQANVPTTIVTHSVEAFEDESCGGFGVKVETDASDVEQLQSLLGNKAIAWAEEAPATLEPAGQPSRPVAADSDPSPAKRGRRSSGKGLYCVSGVNPARPGSKSHAAWECVERNPGLTYAELKPLLLGRMRFISHCVKMGWMEVR